MARSSQIHYQCRLYFPATRLHYWPNFAIYTRSFVHPAIILQVTVILENLFHPDDFIEDASLLKDLESDIRSECAKIGAVEKVAISPLSTSAITL